MNDSSDSALHEQVEPPLVPNGVLQEPSSSSPVRSKWTTSFPSAAGAMLAGSESKTILASAEESMMTRRP